MQHTILTLATGTLICAVVSFSCGLLTQQLSSHITRTMSSEIARRLYDAALSANHTDKTAATPAIQMQTLHTSHATIQQAETSRQTEKTTHTATNEQKQYSSQEIATLVTEGIPSVCSYFTGYLPTLIETGMMIPLALLFIAPVNWWSAGITILGFVTLPIAANMMRRGNIAVQMAQLKKYDHVGQHFEEALKGLTTLKIFAADQQTADQLSSDSEGFRVATMKLLGGQLQSLIGSDVVIACSTILAVTVATVQTTFSSPIIHNLAPIIGMAVIITLLFSPERQLVYLSHSGAVAMRRSGTIDRIIGQKVTTKPEDGENRHSSSSLTAEHIGNNPSLKTSESSSSEIVENSDTQIRSSEKSRQRKLTELSSAKQSPTKQSPTKKPPTKKPPLKCGISVEHLSVDFEGTPGALHNLSFTTPPTGLIGIVGTSGSGKSTLLSVLTGQLSNYQGSVSLERKQIRDWNHEDLVAVQTSARGTDSIFAGTVQSNLDLANRQYSPSDCETALREVDLITDFSDRGLLTMPITFRGENLSGGQRQRLMIARAVLRNTPIYLFDEITSSVDREHDSRIASLMKRLAEDALVLVVSHRLSNVRYADNILVLNHGNLVEQGDFNSLLEGNGLFSQEWKQQEQLENIANMEATR